MSDGSVRAIDAAFRLYLLPQGVFSVAIATVLFPTISRLAARDDIAGMRAPRWPSACGRSSSCCCRPRRSCSCSPEPVVRLVVPARRVRRRRARRSPPRRSSSSRSAWRSTAASLLVIRAFFSLQLPWLATKVAALGVVLNAALDAVLYQPLGTGGIPLATSIVERRDLRGDAVAARRASSGGMHGAWLLDGVLRGAGGERASRRCWPGRPGRCWTTRSGESCAAQLRQHGRRRRRRGRRLRRGRARPSRCPSCGRCRGSGGRYDELLVDQRLIRNFCIIAHIDHGKSTLADRILQPTGAVSRARDAQPGARLDGPRARAGHHDQGPGRARCTTRPRTAQTYELNLIDTPGHVDFSYEVSRSLAACEGALLVVDASQGIEAQTLANTYLAIEGDLEIVPVLNKIDLPGRRPRAARRAPWPS